MSIDSALSMARAMNVLFRIRSVALNSSLTLTGGTSSFSNNGGRLSAPAR